MMRPLNQTPQIQKYKLTFLSMSQPYLCSPMDMVMCQQPQEQW